MTNNNKERLLDWFTDRYISGEIDFIQISQVHKDFKDVPYLSIRVLIVNLCEENFLESLKIGKFNHYYRCFRLNIAPGSEGLKYYVSRAINKRNE